MNKTGLMAAFCSIALLGSCEKAVFDESESREANCEIEIITRSGDTPSAEVSQGRIFVFNGEGTCVSVLSTDAGTQSATTKLPSGTYSIYAIGGTNLDGLSLPDQATATPSSEIALLSSQSMGDVQMTTTNVTLIDGESRQVNLALSRMVFKIKHISILKVPTDVTAVEVVTEPLYKKVLLNGTFADETGAATIQLTKGEDNTWTSDAGQFCFPSKGKPTLTVRFTRATGIKSYTYTAQNTFEANHEMTIKGTYTEETGVRLEGILTGDTWGEPVNITFDFNEEGASTSSEETNDNNGDTNNADPDNSDAPTAGSTYKGLYVVAVNGHTATLLSTTAERKYATDSSNMEGSLNIINTALASWTTPDGITGTWRVPTETEARTFVADANSGSIPSNGGYYYILVDENLKALDFTGSRKINGVVNSLGIAVYLRPVIDVTF